VTFVFLITTLNIIPKNHYGPMIIKKFFVLKDTYVHYYAIKRRDIHKRHLLCILMSN